MANNKRRLAIADSRLFNRHVVVNVQMFTIGERFDPDQVNMIIASETAIAVLALTGWLLDSLLWFLETHPLTLAGFITYLAHSWFALPLLVAILVMLCLRRPSELLSLTIYDERGLPIHQQRDFRLEERVLEPLLASFRGATQEGGLHQISLPTGPVVYFLRQRGLTLVACFSGPPRQAQLDEGLRLLEQQETPTEDLLRDFSPDVAALAATLLNAPVERDLLVHLWTYPRPAMMAAQLAGHVGRSEAEVTTALGNLEQLTLIQRLCAWDMTFFGPSNSTCCKGVAVSGADGSRWWAVDVGFSS